MAQVGGSNRPKLGYVYHSVSQKLYLSEKFCVEIFWKKLKYKKIFRLYPFNMHGGQLQAETDLPDVCLSDLLLISAGTEHTTLLRSWLVPFQVIR